MDKHKQLSFIGYFSYFYHIAKTNIVIIIIASAALSLLDSIGIGVIVALFQSVLNPESNYTSGIFNSINQLSQQWGWGTISIKRMLLITGIVFAVKSIFYYIQLSIQASTNAQIIRYTRLELLKNIENLSFSGFTQLDSGIIQNVSTTEVTRLHGAMIGYFHTWQYLIMAITYLIVAIITNFWVAISICLFGLLFLGIYTLIIKYYKKLSTEISSSGNIYNKYMIQLIQHFKYLKTTNKTSLLSKKIEKEIHNADNKSLTLWKFSALTTSLREPIVLVFVFLIIYVLFTITGQFNTLSIFTMVLLYRTMNYLLITQNHWQHFHQYAGSLNNIIETQQKLANDREVINGSNNFKFNHEINLKNISVKYEDFIALENIDLVIKKNTTTAFVGQSGSGKTSLAAVISGLITPHKGVISIDNQPLTDINLDAYRSAIGYVSQDPVVFNDSVQNNITLWDENPDYSNLERVLKISHLEEFIQELPEGLLTHVGDNGVILSGGQKQRLALARELYKKSTLLILDEATSSLDSHSENLIKNNIENLHGKVTMIIIAHRLSTITQADQICILSNGKIVACGNYTELINESALFQNMIMQQSLAPNNE